MPAGGILQQTEYFLFTCYVPIRNLIVRPSGEAIHLMFILNDCLETMSDLLIFYRESCFVVVTIA